MRCYLLCCAIQVVGSSLSNEVEVEIASDLPASVTSAATTSTIPDFEPTDEWQTVLPGQNIPPGLWVRMDMSTGVKTARLLPADETTGSDESRRAAADKQLQMQIQEVAETSTCESETTSDAMCTGESASSGPTVSVLPAPGDAAATAANAAEEASPANLDALLAARQERLRFLKDNFYLKEDVEQMKQLLSVCIDSTSSVDSVTTALAHLEEYLHQVDNANDWANIGGIDVALTLLQQTLDLDVADGSRVAESPIVDANQTDSTTTETAAPPAPIDLQQIRLYDLQSHAAWVMGTAAQNNPRVQSACRREGAVRILVDLYRSLCAEEQADSASVLPVNTFAYNTAALLSPSASLFQRRASRLRLLSKVIYALSSLIRSSARGQSEFLRADPHAHSLFHSLSSLWPLCADNHHQHPMRCASASENRQLVRLTDALTNKRAGLLHAIIVDHTVNEPEAAKQRSAPTDAADAASQPDTPSPSAAQVPAVAVSDQRLFRAVATDDFCRLYTAFANKPAGPLTSTQVTTRALALDILRTLLTHRPESTTDDVGPTCTSYLYSAREEITTLMVRLQQQHGELAAAELAEAAGEDIPSEHATIQQAAHTIEQILRSQ